MPSSLGPPSKKRKIQSDDRVTELEASLKVALKSDGGSLNGIVDLLQLAQEAAGPQELSKILYALYRVFVLVLQSYGQLQADGDEAKKVLRGWLNDRLNSFVDLLGDVLTMDEANLRSSALEILMSLLKHRSRSVSSETSGPQLHVTHFKRIVNYLTFPRNEELLPIDLRKKFVDEWLSVHDDIRWFYLREVGVILSGAQISAVGTSNISNCVTQVNTFPTKVAELNEWWIPEFNKKPKSKSKSKTSATDADLEPEENLPMGQSDDVEDDWRKFFDDIEPAQSQSSSKSSKRTHLLTIHESLHSLSSHRAVFTRAWLALMKQLGRSGNADQDRAQVIQVLQILHRGVLPHLTRPVLVMDWMAGCVDMGGTAGLLALNALFILMTEYNLDYPSFYTRLYAFLDRDLLHVKHRARFFRLTESFLSSTHLPASLLASFVKRLSRLCLSAPPAAIVVVIPFIYNLLKRNPALMVMIHDPGFEGNDDPYDPKEKDPNHTRALESSLWELQSLTNHYHAPVATLAKIFSEPFTKPQYAMEDFLDHGYSTMLESELTRKVKKEPAMVATVEDLEHLFPTEPLDEDIVARDVVSELWVF